MGIFTTGIAIGLERPFDRIARRGDSRHTFRYQPLYRPLVRNCAPGSFVLTRLERRYRELSVATGRQRGGHQPRLRWRPQRMAAGNGARAVFRRGQSRVVEGFVLRTVLRRLPCGCVGSTTLPLGDGDRAQPRVSLDTLQGETVACRCSRSIARPRPRTGLRHSKTDLGGSTRQGLTVH
jgi:hypothetical protein